MSSSSEASGIGIEKKADKDSYVQVEVHVDDKDVKHRLTKGLEFDKKSFTAVEDVNGKPVKLVFKWRYEEFQESSQSRSFEGSDVIIQLLESGGFDKPVNVVGGKITVDQYSKKEYLKGRLEFTGRLKDTGAERTVKVDFDFKAK